jgi:DNA polymerase-4
MNKTFLHLDLDSFFVSVERLKNPSLIGKPVIVGGSESRGVVSSCSYEARKMGVRSAMPNAQAKRLCPNGIFIHGSHADYGYYSKLVTQIIAAEAPAFYKASIDEFYIDITGMDRFFGCEKWSHELRHKIINESGLPISWGMSSSKMIAKMCTQDAKPNGTYVVKDGEEQAYLDPKSVADIPFVGEKMTQTLNKYGIKTIADLRKWDMDLLVKRFGKNGWYLWHKARGIGNDELPSPKAEKSMSKERTFSENIEDEKEIFAKLFKLTEQLSHELRLAKLQTSCVTIKIRYPDFETYTHQRHIFPSVDTLELYELAKSLLQKAWSDRLPLRQIGIKFSSLTPLEQQLMLFNEHQDQKKYLEVMDILKQKYGKSKVFFGGSM